MEGKVDRNLVQDTIDCMLSQKGEEYKARLRQLNKEFNIEYVIKDNVVRSYPMRRDQQYQQ